MEQFVYVSRQILNDNDFSVLFNNHNYSAPQFIDVSKKCALRKC